MADYNISAEITADASGFESGIKKAQKASKNLSKSVSKVIQGLGKSGLVGALGAVGLASQGVTATLGAVSKITKKVTQTINECTEAYRKQYKAEVALETVAKNNPYMNSSSVRNLKNFASEIQKFSDYGDEELLPLMANLTALGRTEEETMQIMKVAVDMASTGMYTLDTAVQQLNATLNGNIGRLGQQNAELKNLTEEELKNGKAVEILGNKYKGLAETTVDSSKQLQNAIGDFKEIIGQSFEKAFTPMRKYFAEIITKTNNAISKAREHKKAVEDVFKDTGDINLNAQTDNMKISLIALQQEYEQTYKDQQQYLKLYGQYIDQTTDAIALAYERDLKALKERISSITNELMVRKEAEEQAQKEAEATRSQAEIEKTIADLKDKYLQKIAEQETKWKNTELVTGEVVKNEEKLKFYQEQLSAILTESGGQITQNNQYYKDQMAIINGLIKAIADSQELEISTEWADKLKEQNIEILENQRDTAIKNAEETGEDVKKITYGYNLQIFNLKRELLLNERDEALKNVGDVANAEQEKLNIIEYYANEIEGVRKDLLDQKEEENEKEEEEEKKKFAYMIGLAKDYAKNVGKVFKQVGESIKKVFDSIGKFAKQTYNALKDIFSKMFKFNVSDALDSLLAVEDAILTFFVETLPKLPAFFESAFSSVLVLINTLVSAIDWEKVKDVVSSMVETFVKYAPDIVSGIVDLFTGLFDTISSVLVDKAPEIVDAFKEMFFAVLEALPSIFSNVIEVVGTFIVELGKAIIDNADRLTEDLNAVVETIVTGISDFVEGGGWKTILDAIIAIQNAIQTVITDNLEDIVNIIIDMLPDFIDFFVESFVSASQAISKVVKPLMKLIIALIDAIFQILLSDEVMDAGLEVGSALIEGIIGQLIPDIIAKLPKLILKIVKSVITLIPKTVASIVKGLINAFVKTDWVQVIKDIFTGFVDAFKDFFGIHSPSTLFEEFGGFMIEGLWQGIANLGQWLWDNVVGFFSNLWEGITDVFSNVGEWASGVWENITEGFGKVGDWFKDTFSTAWTNAKAGFTKVGDWASDTWKNIKDGFAKVGDWFKTTFSTAWTNAKAGFTKVTDWASGIWKNVKDGFPKVGDWFKTTFSTAWTNVKDAWKGAGDWFKGIADGIKKNFSNCVDNMKSAFSKAGDWVKDMAGKIGSGLSKAGEAIKDGASWVGNKIGSLFGFATGTQQAPSGLALVGEAGPELVNFRGGESVLNARNTQKALEGMGNGRTNNFNVTFNNLQDTSAFAMMNQLKQYNRQMAINGIF